MEGRAVDHRGIDDLASPGALALPQRRADSKGEEHATPAEVADVVEWDRWWEVGAADGVERSCQRDVVDVVPGHARPGAVLAPAGHPPVDQARVPPEALVRSQSLTARPRPAGTLRPARRNPSTSRATTSMPAPILQVDGDGPPTARKHVMPFVPRRDSGAIRGPGPVDPDDIGAHAGHEHGSKRPCLRTPGRIDASSRNAHSVQRSGHAYTVTTARSPSPYGHGGRTGFR